MAVDNTHTKYLKGKDKKAWNNYKEAYEAQKKAENLLSNLMPRLSNGKPLDHDIEVPVRKKKQ